MLKAALIMPFAAYTGTDSCKNSMNDQSACFFLCVCINITRSQQLSYFDYLLYSMNYWWVERCNMIISWRRCAYLPLVLRYAPSCLWPATVNACNFQIAPNGCSIYIYIHVQVFTSAKFKNKILFQVHARTCCAPTLHVACQKMLYHTFCMTS